MAIHCYQSSMCKKELVVNLSIFTHRAANFVGIITPAFYAFLHISEHTSSHSSDIKMDVYQVNQSKTDSFPHSHSIFLMHQKFIDMPTMCINLCRTQ